MTSNQLDAVIKPQQSRNVMAKEVDKTYAQEQPELNTFEEQKHSFLNVSGKTRE